MTPVQQHMAQGGSTAASEAAQAAAAAAAAVGNSTLFTHMAHIRGHEPGGEVNLSQDQSENIHGHLEEEHGERRYLRGQGATYHHPHDGLHTSYDPMEAADFDRYRNQPVDLGYPRGSYSPNATVVAAAAAAASEGWSGQHLTHPDWIADARGGQHPASAGIPWPPHSHDNRYLSPTSASMKWEPASNPIGMTAGGSYKKSKKLMSPGAQSQASNSGNSNLSEIIPDETLQHLTVKELNKRVQNLARDEVVQLKQRRRTLKNRGYAMNCRMRRQENREKLETQVKYLEQRIHDLAKERDFYKAKCENMTHAAAMVATRTSTASLMNGGPADLHMPPGHGGQLDLSLSGAAAAAAAAAAAHHHDEYKRDVSNGYQNNNDLKIGLSADDFRLRSAMNSFNNMMINKSESNNNSPNYYMPMDLKVEAANVSLEVEEMQDKNMQQ